MAAYWGGCWLSPISEPKRHTEILGLHGQLTGSLSLNKRTEKHTFRSNRKWSKPLLSRGAGAPVYMAPGMSPAWPKAHIQETMLQYDTGSAQLQLTRDSSMTQAEDRDKTLEIRPLDSHILQRCTMREETTPHPVLRKSLERSIQGTSLARVSHSLPASCKEASKEF